MTTQIPETEKTPPPKYEKVVSEVIDNILYLFSELGGPDDYLLQFTLKWDKRKKLWVLRFKGIEAIHNSKYQLTYYY